MTIHLAHEGSEVVLSVVDTGIGIPAEEQDHLFSRFFRSSLAMAEEIQGTGLGLALVQTRRGVARRHCRGELGRGSRAPP